MGQLFFTGHGCFYVPSLGQNQPPAAEGYSRIRGMEQGRQPPPPNVVSPASWKFFKIFCRCFTAMVSIALIVLIFVARQYHLDPYLQDPYKMAAVLIFALGPVGFGFMFTQGDIETLNTSARGEALL